MDLENNSNVNKNIDIKNNNNNLKIKLIKKATFKNVNKPFDKKMDKKIIQNIQLIIKDFLQNGELNNEYFRKF